jgi:hypothetical protein
LSSSKATLVFSHFLFPLLNVDGHSDRRKSEGEVGKVGSLGLSLCPMYCDMSLARWAYGSRQSLQRRQIACKHPMARKRLSQIRSLSSRQTLEVGWAVFNLCSCTPRLHCCSNTMCYCMCIMIMNVYSSLDDMAPHGCLVDGAWG